MANYSKQWSSANPGRLIILIDQSGSMSETYFDGESKAVFAAKAVNNVIETVINRNFSSELPKDRCRIAVIGYGDNTHLLCEGSLSELSALPEGTAKVIKKINSGDGTVTEVEILKPYWIKPVSAGCTNMAGAFLDAQILIEKYIDERPDAPAPVIISISDGQPNTGGGFDEVRNIVQSIADITTDDGAPLVFNAHIEANGFNCRFPASKDDIPRSEHAGFMFDISSIIPPSYRSSAEKNDIKLKENARGCMIGTDAEGLIALIDTGSSKARIELPAHEAENECAG
ncbi:MAG: VWA domain-containing protein [Tannerella sp.]|jgi:hypothetical protein|nr:VWA domain-containing protein [Tannerella sp.]